MATVWMCVSVTETVTFARWLAQASNGSSACRRGAAGRL